jgi:hypothetical protein
VGNEDNGRIVSDSLIPVNNGGALSRKLKTFRASSPVASIDSMDLVISTPDVVMYPTYIYELSDFDILHIQFMGSHSRLSNLRSARDSHCLWTPVRQTVGRMSVHELSGLD